jgi:DNA segregation ATPase FtsK/SpoIIIE-like protein
VPDKTAIKQVKDAAINVFIMLNRDGHVSLPPAKPEPPKGAAVSELDQAKQILEEMRKDDDGRMGGCVSYLQRKLECGYNHAARLIEQLEQEEFITTPDSQGKRRLYSRGIEAAEEE